MTKKLSLTSMKIFLPFIFLLAMLAACKKPNPPVDPTDPPVTLTKKEMLVKYTWQADEVLRNISGENSHYKRSEVNNTGVNYDILRITFNSNGTGIYEDELGVTHSTTWQFTSADFRNLTLVVEAPNAATYIWKLVEITPEALHNTTAVGTDILVSARYTPIPRSTPDE